MSSWQRLRETWIDALQGGKPAIKHPPTENEYMSWFEAADEMQPNKTHTAMKAQIEAANPYRMWRLRHDFKWLQKQCRKAGMNPEEARFLL